MRRVGAVVVTLLLAASCSDAPDPGDLAAFCGLLDQGVGLSTTSTEAEFAQLSLVAPPEIRPTIDSLQTQARDFDDLLNVQPPDLEAIFRARFDPAAESERAELDRYAASGCNLSVDRPPTTRWATFVRENHVNAPWRDVTTAEFETTGNDIDSITISFDGSPEQMALVEDTCAAAADFLVDDGAPDAAIRVRLGTTTVLEQSGAAGPCQLP